MAHDTFRAGDLTAVIGDNTAAGGHRAGYNGVWSLTHRTEPANLFMPAVAGLNHEHIFVYGHIRAGRAAVDKTRMIKLMADAVAAAAQVESARAVWVYVNELPPRQMIEFGHVLPEPGDEPAWTAALPEEDRAFMRSIGK